MNQWSIIFASKLQTLRSQWSNILQIEPLQTWSSVRRVGWSKPCNMSVPCCSGFAYIMPSVAYVTLTRIVANETKRKLGKLLFVFSPFLTFIYIHVSNYCWSMYSKLILKDLIYAIWLLLYTIYIFLLVPLMFTVCGYISILFQIVLWRGFFLDEWSPKLFVKRT